MKPTTREPLQRRLSQQEGWTLIELLVSMVMGMVLVLASFPIIDGAANTEGRIQAAALSIGDARAFSDTILRDLRPATSVSPSSSSPSIVVSSLRVNTFVRRTDCVSGTPSPAGDPPTECAVTYTCTGPAGNVSCTRRESSCTAPFAAGAAETVIRGLSSANIFDIQNPAGLDNSNFVGINLAIPNPDGSGRDLIKLKDGTALRNLGLGKDCA